MLKEHVPPLTVKADEIGAGFPDGDDVGDFVGDFVGAGFPDDDVGDDEGHVCNSGII